MNQIKKNRKLDEYKAVVLDLDGTLYYQKPFRMRMVRFLAWHLITHPVALKDMFIILDYRKVERIGSTMRKCSVLKRQWI